MNTSPPELRYLGTCPELGDVYERVHDPDPSTEHGQPAPVDKPRREWRVTKADLEAQVAMAATALESMAERLEDSRRWARYYAKKAAANWVRGDRWLAAALAGWAAFAVAVVW